MTIPNRIALICHGRYDEAIADGALSPGHIGYIKSTGKIAVHNVQGGRIPVRVVEEDALQGKTTADAIADANMCPHRICVKGDMMLFRLATGQNVAQGDQLMSTGDGTLMALAAVLADIVAPSTDITNVTAETTFSNGTVTIPANTLKVGDVLHIRGTAVVTGQNSTNTHQVKVKLGSTTLMDAGAVALAAASVVEFDLYVTIRTIGASGTYVCTGTFNVGAPGTGTAKAVNVGSTAIDTTVANTILVTSTASAQSTGNIIHLDELFVSEGVEKASALVEAAEAVNNSGGTLPFIRGIVI